jgi:hypothetical protein
MLRSLEAVIAVLMIATIFIIFYQTLGVMPEFEAINWKIVGYNGLKSLDRTLGLRQDVQTGNTTAIENKLANTIPITANYTVRICGVSCDTPRISSASLTKIVSVSYVIAGYRDQYLPRQVVLYMWPKS